MIVPLVKHAVAQKHWLIHGVRAIYQGIHWIEPQAPPAMDILKELGYKPVKITRLNNLYYNSEEVRKAKEKLEQRRGEEHSSVAILTRNMEKTHRQSQGWCIQSIVVSQRWQRGQVYSTADVFYRSTELIQKFGADLTLIKNILDQLEVDARPVRFYFANAYVSAVFFPLLFQLTPAVPFLRHIKRHNKEFHFLACKAVSRYLDPHNRYTYRAQVKQWERARTLDRKELDQYLLENLGGYHRDHMPRRGRNTGGTVRRLITSGAA
jgi:hypothetical protein